MSKALVIKNADFSTNALEQITIEENIPCTALSASISAQSVEYVGDTVTITVTKTPVNATDVLQFASSDERIAKVNNSGIVTIIGIGTATITITCGTATATVIVNQANEIKLGGLYNVVDKYADRASSDNNAAYLFTRSGLRTLGAAYDGDENVRIYNGEPSGVQVMRIPYGANYAFIHKASDSYAIGSGRQILFDIDNLTEYNGVMCATYLSQGTDSTLSYKRELANHNATGLVIRHEGGTETNLADYITFSAT